MRVQPLAALRALGDSGLHLLPWQSPAPGLRCRSLVLGQRFLEQAPLLLHVHVGGDSALGAAARYGAEMGAARACLAPQGLPGVCPKSVGSW